jgi:hypothetical protein
MLMLVSPILGLWGMKHLFWTFKDWKFKNVCVKMVCGELRGGHRRWIFIALQFKESQWNIVTPKSLLEK